MSALTIIGVLAAMLLGTIHAFAELAMGKELGDLYPRGWFHR